MFSSFRLHLICSAAVILMGLVGCGQKGPLFMPIKQPGAVPAPVVAPLPAQPTMPSAPTTDGAATTVTPSPR